MIATMSSSSHALRQKVEDGREREAEDRVDLPLRQHRLAHREADRFDGDAAVVDPCGVDERVPLGERGVGRRGAQRLAFERLGVVRHALALAADHGEGRLVVHHVDRVDGGVRLIGQELHQRVDVAEAHFVGAGRDARDRLTRARAGIDGDVEPLVLEVTVVDGDEERGGRPLELPVEREADRGEVLRGERRCNGNSQDCKKTAEHSELSHENSFPNACNDRAAGVG